MYQNIDEQLCEVAQGEIVKKRKSLIPASLVLITGLFVAFLPKLVPDVADSANLASMAAVMGWSLVIGGIVWLLVCLGRGAWYYHHEPSGKRLSRYELLYDVSEKNRIRDLVDNCDVEALGKVPRSTVSSVMAVLYTLPAGDVLWAQAFEFVPHKFVPLTDVVRIPDGRKMAK